MATMKQIRANRKNALKGGVKSLKGKEISRVNARKHGIFASAVTTEDPEELYSIEDRLFEMLKPVGAVEEILVEKIALNYLSMQRCARAQGEYHVRTWQEPDIVLDEYGWVRLNSKQRDRRPDTTPFRKQEFKEMVDLIGLYDTRLTNQFLKLLHELERQQRLRAGEYVPPPIVGDLTIHAATGRPREEDAAPQKEVSIPSPGIESPGSTPPEGPQQSQPTVGQGDSAQKTI